jgi:hypothetical protein
MELLFFTLAFFAEVVATIAGFGSSTLLLPLAMLFFDFKTALVLVAIMHLFGNMGRVTFFRKEISWKVVAFFGVAGGIASALGALLAAKAPQELLIAALGVFLVAYAVFGWASPSFTLKPRVPTMIAGGVLSGFVAGIMGTGGALRSAFLLAFKLPKMAYIGTSAVLAIITDVVRIPVYVSAGLFDPVHLWLLPGLLVVAFAGSYVGKRITKRIPQTVFQKFVLTCLAVVGIKFIVDFILY